jgi:MFS family permease
MLDTANQDATAMTGERRFTALDQFYVSCLWLAYNIQWGALLAIVVPHQIQAMVGPARKEVYNGLIGPIGATMALVITPIAGALSDRSRHPWGRRRPFLLAGVLMNILFLGLLAGFGPGSPIGLFALCYMGLQLGCNWWGGPYAGLIPDVVPEKQRGSASGWMGVMTASGVIIGALAAGQLIRGGSYAAIYALIVVGLLVMLVLTFRGVREQPNQQPPAPFDLGSFVRSFWIDPREHRNFYWLLITRGMVTMGIYSVFTFFQYFLEDVIRVSDPAKVASYLIGTITFMSIPCSFLAGQRSDRLGRKPLVYLSGGLMALALTIYIAVAFFPSLTFTFIVAAIFGCGYGAYTAVDWALALDVLPAGENAAKDMGIWHVSMVLPQIIAPAITGLTLNALKSHSLLLGYTVVFAMTAVWFILGTVFVRQIRGVR